MHAYALTHAPPTPHARTHAHPRPRACPRARRFRVWNALEKALRRYTSLLEDRARQVEATTALARQNEELKILLQEYLGSKINAELHIPPTRLIRVND